VISKPWGREIWYTGIERRGVCRVQLRGGSVPLPVLQSVLAQLPAPGMAPPLLKILDPAPEPIRGDLYFEVHRHKREVYVVSRVDPLAWSEGTGAIRYGICQTKRRAFDSDDALRSAFVSAVRAYERVRRQIDGGDTVDADGTILSDRERLLREQMDAFSTLVPLRAGDVVQVPPGVPHALQHGVQVVEFQTPVYERLILSFAQRVLTQAHWDTEAGARLMSVAPPPAIGRAVAGPGSGRCQVVADFGDFRLFRIHVSARDPVKAPPCTYALLIVLSGTVRICQREGRRTAAVGEAVLLCSRGAALAVADGVAEASLLLAAVRPLVAPVALM